MKCPPWFSAVKLYFAVFVYFVVTLLRYIYNRTTTI